MAGRTEVLRLTSLPGPGWCLISWKVEWPDCLESIQPRFKPYKPGVLRSLCTSCDLGSVLQASSGATRKMKRASGALLQAARGLSRSGSSIAQAAAEASPAAPPRSIKHATLPFACASRGFAATAVPAEAEVQVKKMRFVGPGPIQQVQSVSAPLLQVLRRLLPPGPTDTSWLGGSVCICPVLCSSQDWGPGRRR